MTRIKTEHDATSKSAKAARNVFRKVLEQYGDMPEVLKYFSSHPALEGRAAAAEAADSVGDEPFEPVLSDRDWVALTEICGDKD